jgi:cytochrome c oxidase subunit 2
MLKLKNGIAKLFCLGLAWLPLGVLRAADYPLNMPRGVTPTSEQVYDLHMLIFYVCVVIGLLVFGVMFYSLYKHRKSRGVVPAQFHESTKVEIAWTVIPLIILIAMAVPATKVLQDMHDTSDSELTILITGWRWYWEYEYLDNNVKFFSYLSTPQESITNLIPKGEHYLREVDKPLVLPINKKIRFLFTSADVQHAWWVPDLGFKRDAIPGFINEDWAVIKTPGIYRGACAELCGASHGFMPIEVHAVSEAEFADWLAKEQTPPAQTTQATS